MTTTTIRVDKRTHVMLFALKGPGETFDDVCQRLLTEADVDSDISGLELECSPQQAGGR